MHRGILQRAEHLDAAVEVPRHHVGGGDIHSSFWARQALSHTKAVDSAVLQEAADDRLTRMFSLSPGRPGRRQQMPRTTSSTETPAREASYSASMTSGSTSEFIFIQIMPGRPCRL